MAWDTDMQNRYSDTAEQNREMKQKHFRVESGGTNGIELINLKK